MTRRQSLEVGQSAPLVDFIKDALGLSLRQSKRLLDHRCVWVNGQLVWIAKHPLKRGDRVILFEDPLLADPRNPDILFEDEDLLVFNKRPFIIVTGPSSLELALRSQRKENRLRAVHRLDRETTGCVIFARNPNSQKLMLDVFKQRRIEKEYEAVVHGKVPWTHQRFEQRLDGKVAKTTCHRMATSRSRSLLRVGIETGRKHQIRRHLAAAGFPVVGDKQYGSTDGAVARQLLHASQVAFAHPFTQQKLVIRAPHPDDFAEVLTAFPEYSAP